MVRSPQIHFFKSVERPIRIYAQKGITSNQIGNGWLVSLLLLGSNCLLTNCQYRSATNNVQTATYPADSLSSENRGLRYILGGEYYGSGVPTHRFFVKRIIRRNTIDCNPSDSITSLQPVGRSRIPIGYSVVQLPNSAQIINANCFSCHAQCLNNTLVLGLGTNNSIYQQNQLPQARLLNTVIKLMYAPRSKQRQVFDHFGDYYKAVARHTKTTNPFVNPAFRLEEACVNHRNPRDLAYVKSPNFTMSKPVIASDVPPLWHLKKKKLLYYNGMGEGDKTKLLMQITVMGITDTLMARQVQQHFNDVLAWIKSLKPPIYPGLLDSTLINKGRVLFSRHCANCHGTYGETPVPVDKVIPLSIIKTDPYYALYFSKQSNLPTWYNQSWFATSLPSSRLNPKEGYVAPPLDGIWATAPYLHNGSVPTLMALLNSGKRPLIWQYLNKYSTDEIGLSYRLVAKQTKKDQKTIYDTRQTGYGNVGHYFSDDLSDKQRISLLEYLKSL
jgi:hypothetical protein